MSDSPIPSLARRAALAAAEFRSLDTAARRVILLTIADTLETRREAILSANAQDLAEARDAGRPAFDLARIELDPAQFSGLVRRFRTLADFPEPVKRIQFHKMRVIEHGAIQEKGDHDELLAQKGQYYLLYTGQHQLD